MNKKLYYLDGIKGIACLCVAINHFMNYFYSLGVVEKYNLHYVNYILTNPICTLLYNGNFYVMLFLIISAFITSYTLLIKDDIACYKTAIIKRGTRIILPLIVLFTLIFFLGKLNAFKYISELKNITLSTCNDDKCFENLTFFGIFKTSINCLFETENSFNFVIWMIPLIFQGFFISVILTFLISKMKFKYAVGLLIVSAIIVPLGINTNLILFPIGTLLAYIMYKFKDSNKKINFIIKIILSIMVIIGLYFGSTPYQKTFSGIYSIFNNIPHFNFQKAHIIGSVLVLTAVLFLEKLKKFLSLNIFKFFGRISFSIYLLHFPLQCTFSAFLFIKCYNLSSSYAVSVIVTGITHFIILIGLSFLFSKYIEEKLGIINNKIAKKICEE